MYPRRREDHADPDDPVPPGLVSVIVPAFNEARTIDRVVREVLSLPLRVEVLVVDDASTDATARLAEAVASEDARARVLRHADNRGKGAAVRTGIAASTGDVVVIQDADVEYDPRDLPSIVLPVLDGHADAVYGTRLRGGRLQRAHLFWHSVGNRVLSLLTRAIFNTTISDVEVGTKAFYGPLLRSFPLRSDDFRFEIEVTARTLRTPGVRVFEAPISYYGRSVAEGKKISWRDGVLALGALARYATVRSPPLHRPGVPTRGDRTATSDDAVPAATRPGW